MSCCLKCTGYRKSGETVLTRDDYEQYHLEQSRGPFVTALSGDLVEKTFLFLGFSFTDPTSITSWHASASRFAGANASTIAS